MIAPLGATGRSGDVWLLDANGAGITGKTAATFPALTYSRAGANADVAWPTLVDLAALTDPWTPGGIKERGDGLYRVDYPDAIYSVLGDVTIRVPKAAGALEYPIIQVGPVAATVVGGTGSGANTVTLTVNDGAAAIQNAKVRLTAGAATYLGVTDVNGQVTFNIDDATWTVAITAVGYAFAGAALVVAADATHIYSMTATVIAASPVGATTGYATCYDNAGNAEAGVVITAVLSRIPAALGDVGHVYDNATRSATSDANGLVQFTGLVPGLTYTFSRGTSSKTFQITIPANAGATYALPSFVGNP